MDREKVEKWCKYQDIDLKICHTLDVTQREESTNCGICNKSSHGNREMLVQDSQCGATFCTTCFLSRASKWDTCAACKRNVKTEHRLTFEERQLIQKAEDIRLRIRCQLAETLRLVSIIKHEIPKHTSSQADALPLSSSYVKKQLEQLVASVMQIQYSYIDDTRYWMKRTKQAYRTLEIAVACIKGTVRKSDATSSRRWMSPQERADSAIAFLKKAVMLLREREIDVFYEAVDEKPGEDVDASMAETAG